MHIVFPIHIGLFHASGRSLDPAFYFIFNYFRTSMNVPPSKKAKVYVVSEDPEVLAIFEHSRVFFATLGYASEVVLQKDKSGIADDAVSAVTAKATIYMPFAELVDLDKEIERLTKEEIMMDGSSSCRLQKISSVMNGIYGCSSFKDWIRTVFRVQSAAALVVSFSDQSLGFTISMYQSQNSSQMKS